MDACRGRRPRSIRREDGYQQLSLLLVVAADPIIEVMAAQVLMLAIEECRTAGVVVHHAHVQIDA